MLWARIDNTHGHAEVVVTGALSVPTSVQLFLASVILTPRTRPSTADDTC